MVTFLTACSQSSQEVQYQFVKITVERTGNLLTNLRKVTVYIDGDEVMKLKGDETDKVELSLEPGVHTIQTKGQGDKSTKVEFEVTQNSTNEFYFTTEISNVNGVKLDLINGTETLGTDKQDEATDETTPDLTSEQAANNKESKPSQQSSIDEDAKSLEEVIRNYLYTYSAGNITALSSYVSSASSFYSEQLAYMDSLSSRGIHVSILDYEITDIQQPSELEYRVKVSEDYEINNPNGTKQVSQVATYTIEVINGEYFITNLEI